MILHKENKRCNLVNNGVPIHTNYFFRRGWGGGFCSPDSRAHADLIFLSCILFSKTNLNAFKFRETMFERLICVVRFLYGEVLESSKQHELDSFLLEITCITCRVHKYMYMWHESLSLTFQLFHVIIWIWRHLKSNPFLFQGIILLHYSSIHISGKRVRKTQTVFVILIPYKNSTEIFEVETT